MKIKKRTWLCIFLVGLILIVILIAALLWHKRTPFMESVSPTGDYHITVYRRRGTELLNLTEHMTIVVRKKQRFSRSVKIYDTIHNDNGQIAPNKNVFILWSDDQAFVVLLGIEQEPKFIEISLEDGITYEQHQYDDPPGTVKKILEEHGVNTDWVDPMLHLDDS